MELPAQPILGLIDGMEVLQFLASTQGEISSTEVSRQLGIEKTKTNRILKTLAHLGYVQPTNNRKYTLGSAVHVLSAQLLHGSGLMSHALQHLLELTEMDCIVAMGVLWRDKVSYIYHWQPGLSPLEGIGRTALFPMSQSSIGLALCAEQDEKLLEKTLSYQEDLPGFQSKADFLKEIELTQKRGYAVANYENKKSIAVKVGDPAYAAIALAKIDPNADELYYTEILKEKAQKIRQSQNTKK